MQILLYRKDEFSKTPAPVTVVVCMEDTEQHRVSCAFEEIHRPATGIL